MIVQLQKATQYYYYKTVSEFPLNPDKSKAKM